MTPDLTTVEGGRSFLMALSEHAREYAGIPMPVNGHRLQVHPGFKFAEVLNNRDNLNDDDSGDERFHLVNSWIDRRTHRTILVLRRGNDRRAVMTVNAGSPADFLLNTTSLAPIWTMDAEVRAMEKLESLVSEEAFHSYLMTGMFVERSPRSGIAYLFRRLRPTLAVSTRNGEDHFIAGLCLHPIGYYEHSFAGSLVPTDDVIGHLCLMRADEHRFWKLANHHSPKSPSCGLS